MIIAVSGGDDRQPNLNNYYLSIDTIRATKGKKKIYEDRHLEGECHFTLSDDGDEFYLIHCDVYDRRKGEGYFLHLDDITKTDHKEIK